MSEYQPSLYLIAYDIADPRRLQRVHYVLAASAFALQYSVFLFLGSQPALQRLIAKTLDRMELREDDLRIYPIPLNCYTVSLGRQHIPNGVALHHHDLLRVLAPLRPTPLPATAAPETEPTSLP